MLEITVVVEADSLSDAQACVTSCVRRALLDVGGELSADAAVRGTAMTTRELAV